VTATSVGDDPEPLYVSSSSVADSWA